MRSHWSALAIGLGLSVLGCKSREPVRTAPADAPARFEALGTRPVNPRRAAPPPTLASSALALGAQAPSVALTDETGAPWSLADALTKARRVMLVFYRGDW